MIKQENYKYIAFAVALVLIYGFVLALGIVKTNEWRSDKSQEYLSKGKTTQNLSDRMLLFEQAAVLDANEVTYLNTGITALSLGNNGLAEKYLGRVKTAEGYFQLANAYYNLEKFDLASANYQKSLDKTKTAENYAGFAKSELKQGRLDQAKAAFEFSSGLQKSEEVTNLLVLLGEGTNDTNVSRETSPANRAVLVYNALESLGYPQSAQIVLHKALSTGLVTRDGLLTLANVEISKNNYEAAYGYLLKAKAIDPYYPQTYQQLVLVSKKLGKADESKQYQALYASLNF